MKVDKETKPNQTKLNYFVMLSVVMKKNQEIWNIYIYNIYIYIYIYICVCVCVCVLGVLENAEPDQ